MLINGWCANRFWPLAQQPQEELRCRILRGYIQFPKCTIVLLLCIALLQIPMQIDISIRISNLILYNSSELSEMNQSKYSLRRRR